MVIYRHSQAGTLTRWSLGCGVALVALALLGNPAQPPIALVVLAILLSCLLVFHSLTISVSADAVVMAFGPGWIRRSVPLSSIRAVRPVQNPWWYGWGIRMTPHGWLWNVSGLQAIELELHDGSRLRIGTDEPQRLQAAIEQAKRLRG
jgi:hypothetical protein